MAVFEDYTKGAVQATSVRNQYGTWRHSVTGQFLDSRDPWSVDYYVEEDGTQFGGMNFPYSGALYWKDGWHVNLDDLPDMMNEVEEFTVSPLPPD